MKNCACTPSFLPIEMHEYPITRSSLLPLHPFVQHDLQRKSSDQVSRTSIASCDTIQRGSRRKQSVSESSQQSSHSIRLRVSNENVPFHRNASHSSLPATPTPISALSVRQNREKVRRRSSWDNELPLALRSPNAPSPLSDPGPLENVDLSCLQENGISEPSQNHGTTFNIQSNEAVPAQRYLFDESQETTAARTFTADTNHPFKSGRTFKRWVGSLRQHRPSRVQSLTVREARWNLDDRGDNEPAKSNASQRNRRNGHQKSSSWSPFGFVASVKAAANPSASCAEDRSPKSSRKRRSKSNRNSTASATINCGSTGSRAYPLLSHNQAALERATQRRRLLDELLSSEESYVADLKVLLHVNTRLAKKKACNG